VRKGILQRGKISPGLPGHSSASSQHGGGIPSVYFANPHPAALNMATGRVTSWQMPKHLSSFRTDDSGAFIRKVQEIDISPMIWIELRVFPSQAILGVLLSRNIFMKALLNRCILSVRTKISFHQQNASAKRYLAPPAPGLLPTPELTDGGIVPRQSMVGARRDGAIIPGSGTTPAGRFFARSAASSG
jgi:hypothetical protein